jgi:hypothetical protein
MKAGRLKRSGLIVTNQVNVTVTVSFYRKSYIYHISTALCRHCMLAKLMLFLPSTNGWVVVTTVKAERTRIDETQVNKTHAVCKCKLTRKNGRSRLCKPMHAFTCMPWYTEGQAAHYHDGRTIFRWSALVSLVDDVDHWEKACVLERRRLAVRAGLRLFGYNPCSTL